MAAGIRLAAGEAATGSIHPLLSLRLVVGVMNQMLMVEDWRSGTGPAIGEGASGRSTYLSRGRTVDAGRHCLLFLATLYVRRDRSTKEETGGDDFDTHLRFAFTIDKTLARRPLYTTSPTP